MIDFQADTYLLYYMKENHVCNKTDVKKHKAKPALLFHLQPSLHANRNRLSTGRI